MALAVFTGPSLPAAAVTAALPSALVLPPAARGDVARAVRDGAREILLIDGAFAHRRAVSPGELVAALRSGARITGAASLGAIRATECAPAGMAGSGAVARLFALRVLRDDDEVAVAVEPDRGHRAASLALINVRFAVLGALRSRRLDRRRGRSVLAAARSLHFSERSWATVFARAGLTPSPELTRLCAATDVKRRDAARAVAQIAGAGAREERRVAPTSELHRHAAGALVRYRGHDPWFGGEPNDVARDLVAWLAASGRRAVACEGEPAVIAALRARRELDGELLRRHAVRAGAARIPSPDGPPLGPWLAAARAEIAAAHGYASWAALEAACRRPGGPAASLAAIRRAASELALARRNLTASYT